MRVDARALLDRLGKNEFTYKEFTDRFSELELWPLFEALLKDPRLARLDDTAQGLETGNAEAAFEAAPPARTGNAAAGHMSVEPSLAGKSSAPKSESFNAMFARFENPGAVQGAPVEEVSRQKQDVRAMLRELSQLNQTGRL